MNAYERFSFSLLAEFKCQGQWQIQSLWIDWMDLEAAAVDQTHCAITQRALRRIRNLGRAGDVVNAPNVRAGSEVVERRLTVLSHTPVAARPKMFEALYRSTTELAEALRVVDEETSIPPRARRASEPALAEYCID